MDVARKIQSSRHRGNDPPAPLSTASFPPDTYAAEMENSTSWDSHYQRRGRNREQFDYVNSSSEERFSPNNQEQQYPRQQHSPDSRQQYKSNKNYDSSSSRNTASYREGFPASPQINSHRAHSDVGLYGGTDSFQFFQLPRYEAVIHDDSILYSSGRQHRCNVIIPEQLSTDVPVGVTGSPTRSPTRSSTAQNQTQCNISQRIEFAEQQPSAKMNNIASAGLGHHNRHSLYDQERQYYDYAKDNLITFGRCDAPTASTGFSQEELLQRKRREETREKRKEKRRNKTNKHRIVNFPSSLLKTSSQQQQQQQQQQQYSHQQQQSSSNYKNMATFMSLESNSCGEIANNGNGVSPNQISNSSRDKGIRGSMVSLFVTNGISMCTLCVVLCVNLCRIFYLLLFFELQPASVQMECVS